MGMKDTPNLEQIQHHAAKVIPNDYTSSYKFRAANSLH